MEFTFKVTQTDVYSKEISVQADTLEEARETLDADLEACPLDCRSNTFESSDYAVTQVVKSTN